MTKLLTKPLKIQESFEVREYALLQSLTQPLKKKSKLGSTMDLVSRISLFYIMWLLATDAAVYIWRLLTCPC
jgi:hypothetical protein